MKNTLPFEIGDVRSGTIDALSYGGEGIARPNGIAVFIPRTAPKDEVKFEITDVRKKYARGKLIELQTASPLRTEPKCPHFEKCGGCHYQHLPVETASKEKQTQLSETLRRLGPGETPVQPIKTSPDSWNYRNRLTYHRDENGNQGYISWTDYRVLDVEHCPLAKPELNDIWKKVRENLKEVSSSTLPYVVLRSTNTGEKAVILSIALEEGEEVRLEEIREHTQPLSSIANIFVSFVKPGSKSALGKELHCLHGQSTFREKVGNVEFLLRPDLFFQVHPSITEELVGDVLSEARQSKGQTALDLYCGAGLFSLSLAKAGITTLGVEVQHEAVQSAQMSAKENGLGEKAEFRAGKADRIVEKLVRANQTFDIIVVDPPRKGLQPKVIEAIPKLGAHTILYVSCSPPTLARDLKILNGVGYHVEKVQPYDLFPQTYHLETLAVLRRK